jgi:hypothetical protein
MTKPHASRSIPEPQFVLCGTVKRRGSGCGILLDVVQEPSNAAPGEIFILEQMPGLLAGVVEQLLTDRHALRIDLPRDVPDQPWICRSQVDLNKFVAALDQWSRDSKYYPISVWRIPTGVFHESSAAIDRFRDAPWDEVELAKVQSWNVWRVFVFPSSMTFSVPCDDLMDAEILVEGLLSESPLPVDWI